MHCIYVIMLYLYVHTLLFCSFCFQRSRPRGSGLLLRTLMNQVCRPILATNHCCSIPPYTLHTTMLKYGCVQCSVICCSRITHALSYKYTVRTSCFVIGDDYHPHSVSTEEDSISSGVEEVESDPPTDNDDDTHDNLTVQRTPSQKVCDIHPPEITLDVHTYRMALSGKTLYLCLAPYAVA